MEFATLYQQFYTQTVHKKPSGASISNDAYCLHCLNNEGHFIKYLLFAVRFALIQVNAAYMYNVILLQLLLDASIPSKSDA